MDTKFLTVQDGKISYEETGSGPLVICLPSMGDLRAEYRFLAPALAEAGYRVVSMDLRGLGESSVDWPDYSVAAIGSDILSLIRALDSGPAIVIGESMAAGAAIWAAVEAPELIDRLVLIGPAVRGEVEGFSRKVYALLFARPWGLSAWLTYFNTLYPSRKPADFAAYRAALGANLRQPGRLEALKEMMLASKAASAQRASFVQAPTFILMGTRDPDFKDPEGEARWLAGATHARYEMVSGAGHYPQAEFPEIVVPRILSFLQGITENERNAYVA